MGTFFRFLDSIFPASSFGVHGIVIGRNTLRIKRRKLVNA